MKDIKNYKILFQVSGKLYLNYWWRSGLKAYLLTDLHGREGPLRREFTQKGLEWGRAGRYASLPAWPMD